MGEREGNPAATTVYHAEKQILARESSRRQGAARHQQGDDT